MGVVKIKDKTFETSISESQIKQRLKELGSQISADLKDDNPLFIAVLNGSFIFAADLLREVTIPCEVTFVKVASYEGTASTGKVKQLIGVNQDLTGRTVVIVEDIIESGLTYDQYAEWRESNLDNNRYINLKSWLIGLRHDMLKEEKEQQ